MSCPPSPSRLPHGTAPRCPQHTVTWEGSWESVPRELAVKSRRKEPHPRLSQLPTSHVGARAGGLAGGAIATWYRQNTADVKASVSRADCVPSPAVTAYLLYSPWETRGPVPFPPEAASFIGRCPVSGFGCCYSHSIGTFLWFHVYFTLDLCFIA